MQQVLKLRKLEEILTEDVTSLSKRQALVHRITLSYKRWLRSRGIRLQDKYKYFLSPCVCSGSVLLGTTHNDSDTDMNFFWTTKN